MRFLKWVLIAAASAALLAGCGRSSNDQGSGAAGKSSSAAAEQTEAQPAPETASSESAEQAASAMTGKAQPEKMVEVYFAEPIDGSTVTSPVHVVMAARGVKVAPAGTMEEGTGHMHVMVDAPFVKAGKVIPNDEHHIHYGDGSTEADLDLKPGKHTLRLEFADGEHKAFKGDQYRDTVHITVQAPAGSQDQEGGQGGGG